MRCWIWKSSTGIVFAEHSEERERIHGSSLDLNLKKQQILQAHMNVDEDNTSVMIARKVKVTQCNQRALRTRAQLENASQQSQNAGEIVSQCKTFSSRCRWELELDRQNERGSQLYRFRRGSTHTACRLFKRFWVQSRCASERHGLAAQWDGHYRARRDKPKNIAKKWLLLSFSLINALIEARTNSSHRYCSRVYTSTGSWNSCS